MSRLSESLAWPGEAPRGDANSPFRLQLQKPSLGFHPSRWLCSNKEGSSSAYFHYITGWKSGRECYFCFPGRTGDRRKNEPIFHSSPPTLAICVSISYYHKSSFKTIHSLDLSTNKKPNLILSGQTYVLANVYPDKTARWLQSPGCLGSPPPPTLCLFFFFLNECLIISCLLI